MKFLMPDSLRLNLMLSVIAIALLCLLSTASYVLYQTNLESRHEVTITAKSIDNHLEVQLFRVVNGFMAPDSFPDLSLWLDIQQNTGLCMEYADRDGTILQRLCRGSTSLTKNWPYWFESLYKWTFNPGQKVVRQIAYNHEEHGMLTLTPDMELEIFLAWSDIQKLIGLSGVTVFSLCILMYFAIGRALQPANVIVTVLENMSQGNLSARLPNFKINEWQRTSKAVNQLVTSLEQTLFERQRLAFKLINVQEQERRFLARELHDEFGQCLAGLQVNATSILQTANEKCPDLMSESQNISNITAFMMDILRNMLLHLRPSDLDELGLSASLTSMVAKWNVTNGDKTHYEIAIYGDVNHIAEPIPSNIFRIVQECLSNISKHSKAKMAKVILEISVRTSDIVTKSTDDRLILTVKDDGIADINSFQESTGIGLLGIRERVNALGGEFMFQKNMPTGLIIHITIPLKTSSKIAI